MTTAQGITNLTGWIRRKLIAAVNKALRDIGKAAAQVVENGVKEAERKISQAKDTAADVNKTVNNTAKSVGKKLGF